MRLVLVRHAKAEERNDALWPDDADRPLSERGVERFIAATKGLRKLVTPDVLLTSPYVRAAHTAALLAKHAKWPGPVEEPKIPAGELTELVESALRDGTDTLAIVGHEPTLSMFASSLTSGSPDAAINMKTGSAVLIDLHSSTSGELQWLATPKLLRAAGK